MTGERAKLNDEKLIAVSNGSHLNVAGSGERGSDRVLATSRAAQWCVDRTIGPSKRDGWKFEE